MVLSNSDNPAIEEAPESTIEETSEETIEQPQDDGDELDIEGQAQIDDDEEVDYDGNKYKVPKALAEVIKTRESMNRDYTQKTQAAAEERRAFEAERQEARQQIEYEKQMVDDIAQARHVESRLQYLNTVNPHELSNEDRQSFILEKMQLDGSKAALTERIQGRQSEIAAIEQQNDAKQIRQAMQELSKPDERLGWTGNYDEKSRTSLTSFGKELGFSEGELSSIRSPTAIKTLHLAKIGYETLKKQRAASAPQRTEAKPVPTVGGAKARGSVDPLKLSTDQWMKWRSQQVSSRNK